MDEAFEDALARLLTRREYAEICPETARRVLAEEARKRGGLKEAEKAARARLHAITGAFLTREGLKRAQSAMDEYAKGDADALNAALSLHASTRERLKSADALYDRAFSVTGAPRSLLDLACGLNPLYLGARGMANVTGVDIHAGCVRLINDAAARLGWRVAARLGDLAVSVPDQEADVALFMKLLPLLEAQRPGAATEALRRVRCRHIVVTFPTRTLGGRGVGMEAHYTRWMEARAGEIGRVLDRFLAGDELVYVLEGGLRACPGCM